MNSSRKLCAKDIIAISRREKERVRRQNAEGAGGGIRGRSREGGSRCRRQPRRPTKPKR